MISEHTVECGIPGPSSGCDGNGDTGRAVMFPDVLQEQRGRGHNPIECQFR